MSNFSRHLDFGLNDFGLSSDFADEACFNSYSQIINLQRYYMALVSGEWNNCLRAIALGATYPYKFR